MLGFRARRNRTGEGGAYIRDVNVWYTRGDLSESSRTFFFASVKRERTTFMMNEKDTILVYCVSMYSKNEETFGDSKNKMLTYMVMSHTTKLRNQERRKAGVFMTTFSFCAVD